MIRRIRLGAPQFLLIADPSAPNGGLLERFNGFENTLSPNNVDPLNLPSVGISFDGATPSDDFVTNMYSLEYDGFTDFPRYPINFLADLNAFLGIETLHGTYLNGGVDGSGPTAEQIANAILLPWGSGGQDGTTDSLTNYYMIDETAPLVSLLPRSLQELPGPDPHLPDQLGLWGRQPRLLGHGGQSGEHSHPARPVPRRELERHIQQLTLRCGARIPELDDRHRPVGGVGDQPPHRPGRMLPQPSRRRHRH